MLKPNIQNYLYTQILLYTQANVVWSPAASASLHHSDLKTMGGSEDTKHQRKGMRYYNLGEVSGRHGSKDDILL